MIGKIIGTGKYLPPKVVTNHDLAKIVDTNDQWIVERTGIKSRHFVEEDTTTTMAIKAAKEAVADANIDPLDVDLILVATMTPDVLTPNVSCYVQESLGATNSTCMDINAACVGFLLAYQVAQTYIQTGQSKCAIVVGVDTISAITNFEDRSNCILFADGAGAVVLKEGEGRVESVMYTDAHRGKVLQCESRVQKNWKQKEEEKLTYVHMEGQEVFKFATKEVPIAINNVLEKAGVDKDELDYLVLHQANGRILDFITKRLKLDPKKVPSNIEHCGNTSAASIPLLIDDLFKNGTLKEGQKIVVAGFGGGLSWGASYIEL